MSLTDADCRRMAAEAMTKWGRIDALVNSAGTTRFADHADLEALSGDDFLEVYRINVVGPGRWCVPSPRT